MSYIICGTFVAPLFIILCINIHNEKCIISLKAGTSFCDTFIFSFDMAVYVAYMSWFSVYKLPAQVYGT